MSTPTTPETLDSAPTDKEKLTALFNEFGIGFKQDNTSNNILCEQGNARIVGYRGFLTEFEFTPDGQFVQMNILE